MNNAAKNICVVFCVDMRFISLGSTPRSEIAGRNEVWSKGWCSLWKKIRFHWPLNHRKGVGTCPPQTWARGTQEVVVGGGAAGAALGGENLGHALEWRALAEPCRVGCTEIAEFEKSRGLSRKEAQHKPKPHGGYAHSPQTTGQFVWRKRLSRVLSCEHRYVVNPSQLYCLMSTGSARQSPVADPGKLATGER